MAHPYTTPGILPSHRTLEQDIASDVLMTRYAFEANARHRTVTTDGVITMRVLKGQVQVIGGSGHEAWTIGAGELVALSGLGPFDVLALKASEMWIGVHRAVSRAPRFASV